MTATEKAIRLPQSEKVGRGESPHKSCRDHAALLLKAESRGERKARAKKAQTSLVLSRLGSGFFVFLLKGFARQASLRLMPVTRQQKEESLAELTAAFQKAKSVVFTQYQGTNVKNMRMLRKNLLEKKVKFKVARKTLMKLGAKKIGFEEIPVDFLQGPIGLAFGMEDELAPLKVVYDFGKTADTVKIAGAIFEGKLVAAAQAKELAALPGKEVLLAKLVGLMKSPISGFHSVLHGVLRSFVYALSEVQKKKPA